MKIEAISTIEKGQDGAIWDNCLFRFNAKGHCRVYDLRQNFTPIAEFVLDKAHIIPPHSNSVMFGNEYFDKADRFPLLYSNLYNSFSKSENKMEGVCLVYRLQENEGEFTSTLVQIIEIGFTKDPKYWCSEHVQDARPYGNFTIDRENSVYYAFTMRDESQTTRYFSFPLPKLCEGTPDSDYGVKKVVLTAADLIDSFDCEYHRFIQGAAFHDGKIYSLEGFTDRVEAPPALRVIDTAQKKQTLYFPFADAGLSIEPEMIDFDQDECYYADAHGNLYKILF